MVSQLLRVLLVGTFDLSVMLLLGVSEFVTDALKCTEESRRMIVLGAR